MDLDSNDPSEGGSAPLRDVSRQRTNSSRLDTTRALPTRVSKACARCRRHKIRCDTYRPCSLCVRAKVNCVSVTDAPMSYKWPRNNGRSAPRTVASRSDPDDSVMVQTNDPQDEVHRSMSATQFAPESQRNSPVSPSAENLDNSPESVYQEAQSSMDITRKIIRMHGRPVMERTTSAIPDGEDQLTLTSRRPSLAAKHAVHSVLGVSLPAKEIMDELLEEYFYSVHWFSLVIYEPTFRPQYDSVVDGYATESQKGFLILLATVLGIASWYRAKTSAFNTNFVNEDWDGWRVRLFAVAEARFLELMDDRSLAALQTCLLLGTYHLYHGRPNASLAMLGATIKLGQAMNLHRDAARGSSHNIEERKRVWWTIYTWDRFASITYGRPLSINDSDCNVSMPADVKEWAKPQTSNQEGVLICFSTYQTQLNKLYMIASPLIKTIFGLRISSRGKETFATRYASLMEDITQRLTTWRDELPSSHLFNFDSDIPLEASMERKVYQRQALALQLTYDNILIILHRPILAQQIESLFRNNSTSSQDAGDSWTPISPSIGLENTTEIPLSNSSVQSSQQWWAAAVRISCVTKLPNTTQLATDSHLVGFLSIVLFNSAVVMVVYALSDLLSDRAQEAKRNLTRIFRLVDMLGRRSSLSRQSTVILQDVIQLLLDRENQEMLGTAYVGRGHDEETADISSSLMGHQLRDPLPVNPQVNLGSAMDLSTNPGLDEVFRLNESLSYVQRAVFPGNDFDTTPTNAGIPAAEQQGAFENTNYQGGWIPENDYGFDNAGSYPENFAGVDNEIYWIWKPS